MAPELRPVNVQVCGAGTVSLLHVASLVGVTLPSYPTVSAITSARREARAGEPFIAVAPPSFR